MKSNDIRISFKTAKYTTIANSIDNNRTDSAEFECESKEEACQFGGLPANTAHEVRILVWTKYFGNFCYLFQQKHTQTQTVSLLYFFLDLNSPLNSLRYWKESKPTLLGPNDIGNVNKCTVPRDILLTSYAANSIAVSWKPPASLNEPIPFYEITTIAA